MQWLLLLLLLIRATAVSPAAGLAARTRPSKKHIAPALAADKNHSAVHEEHAQCVLDVVRTQMRGVRQLIVVGASRPPSWLGDVLAGAPMPVVLVSGQNRTDAPALSTHSPREDAVLLTLEGSGSTHGLDQLPRGRRYRILVWLPAPVNDSLNALRPELASLAQTAWHRKQVRVVFLVSGSGTAKASASKCQVFTMRPYPAVCQRRPIRIQSVCTWSAGRAESVCLRRGHVFPDLRKLDLHGCRLQIAISVEAPFAMFSKKRGGRAKGVAGWLLEEWAKFGNFSMHVTDRPSRITRYPGASTGGALSIVGDLMMGRRDVALGAFLLTPDRAARLDFVRSHGNMYYEWAVPTGLAPVVGLSMLFNELNADTWACEAVALVVVTACTRTLWRYHARLGWASGRSPRSSRSRTSFMCTMGILGAALVSVPMPLQWKRERSQAVRLLFSSWILFALVLSTAYVSMLLTRLTVSSEDTNIYSLEELAELELPLYVAPSVLHYLRVPEENDTALAKVLARSKLCMSDVLGQAFIGLAVGRNVTALWAHEASLYALQRLEHRYHEGGTVDYGLHSFGRVLDLPFSYLIFPRGSPLVEQADYVLQRMEEAGVLTKWMSQVTDLKRWRALRGRVPNRVVLTRAHMEPIFHALYLGYGASIAIFIAELAYTRGLARQAPRRVAMVAGAVPSVLGPSRTFQRVRLKQGNVVN